MRDGGRLAAAIAVLDDFSARRVPLKVALADWGRGARYAGSKDRAFVSGLCLDALRRWASRGGAARPAVRLTLMDWGWDEARIAAAFADEPHGPDALTEEERAAAPQDAFDAPDWLRGPFARLPEGTLDGLCQRAPVDLRVNTLKGDQAQALKATGSIGTRPAPLAVDGLRIPAPPPADRAPAVTIIPAYGRGLVEVQDEGSQIAALCAGDVSGAQVLDLCAGGGGKTLALAALMANTGQLYAYDADPRRLAPIHERLRRAGVRNVQVRSPADGGNTDDLEGKMDIVVIDAPCTGVGTWRRRPDAKWRLTEAQLAERQAEQDGLLADGARLVRPGGVVLYVTCSPLYEENEDRVAAFLEGAEDFSVESAAAAIPPGALTEAGAEKLPTLEEAGVLRLDPARSGTDGFTVTRLRRAA